MKIWALLKFFSRVPVGLDRHAAATIASWTLPSLGILALAGTFAAAPVSAFETGVHKRVTRNALPFLAEDVLDTIVAGNEDEDEGDEADFTERHAQNCRFRDTAAYANMRYEEVIDALRQPRANDPNRAARLFGHITHGIQDFYSHSNWIPAPPQGLGIRNRILDSGLGRWTVLDPYTNIFDDVVNIEGNLDGVTAVLPRDSQGLATSGVPIVTDRRIFVARDVAARPIQRDPRVRTYRGLMMSVAGKNIDATNQFCPPIGSNCSIKVPPGRTAEALCLRHGRKRSHGSDAKTFSIDILPPLTFPPETH